MIPTPDTVETPGICSDGAWFVICWQFLRQIDPLICRVVAKGDMIPLVWCAVMGLWNAEVSGKVLICVGESVEADGG